MLCWLLGKTKSYQHLWTTEVKLWLWCSSGKVPPGRGTVEQGSTHGADEERSSSSTKEKILGTYGHRRRNTEVQKGRAKCGEIPRVLFGRSRVETGERRVASPGQMLDLQEDLRCSDGKVCQGHAVASQWTCPILFEVNPPCHAISWEGTGLRWMKTTLMRKAILVKMSSHAFS